MRFLASTVMKRDGDHVLVDFGFEDIVQVFPDEDMMYIGKPDRCLAIILSSVMAATQHFGPLDEGMEEEAE